MRDIEGWPEIVRSAMAQQHKNYSAYGCGSCKNAEWAVTTMRKESDRDSFTGKTVEKTVIKIDLVLCRVGACIVNGNKLSPVTYCTMHNDGAEDLPAELSAESSGSPLGFEAKPRSGGLNRGVLGLEPDLMNKFWR